MKTRSITTLFMAVAMTLTFTSCDRISAVIDAIMGKKPKVDLSGLKLNPNSPTPSLGNTSGYSVQTFVNEINQGCPLQINEGLTMSHASIEGRNVVVYVYVNEYVYTLNSLAANTSKANIRQWFSAVGDQYVRTMANANMNFVYRYVGSSTGQTVQILFTPQELRNMAQ
ncbi:MAG: hypothetical protein K6D91_03495 [Prevotella sp.]|nr:hypothetical protein [Prevotella sp.]